MKSDAINGVDQKVDQKLVEHVAALANLELSGEEITYYQTQLTKILVHIEQLKQLPEDTTIDLEDEIAVLQPPFSSERSDSLAVSLPADIAVAGAPQRSGTAFQVPRIIE